MRRETFTPRHVKAARSWLGWTAEMLSEKSNVGISTVRDFERGARHPIVANLKSMRSAFEEEGIVFTEHGFFQTEEALSEHPSSS